MVELCRCKIEQECDKIIDNIAVPFEPFKENVLVPQIKISASIIIKTLAKDKYEEIIKSYCKSKNIEMIEEPNQAVGAYLCRYIQH